MNIFSINNLALALSFSLLGQGALATGDSLTDLRQKLSAKPHSVSRNLLQTLKNVESSPERISFSQFVKQKLNRTGEGLEAAEKYSAPMTIDPGTSFQENAQALHRQKMFRCSALLDRDFKSIDLLVDSLLMDTIGNPENTAKTESNAQLMAQLSAEVDSRIGIEARKRLLGDIRAVEVIGGIPRKISFTNISLNLSMLLTLRSGKEETFLKTADCVLERAEEFEWVLNQRTLEMTNSSVANKARELRAQLGDLTTDYDRVSGDDKTKSSLTKKIMQQMDDDPLVKYVYLYAKLQKQQGFATQKDEQLFITTNLNRVRGVLNYLRPQVEGTKRIDAVLLKMKPSEVSALTDMMLDLHASGSQAMFKSGNELSLLYLKQVGRQIEDVIMKLDEEVMAERSKQRDEKILRAIIK